MRRLLSRIFGSPASPIRRRLGIEALDDRCVPATLQVLNGLLTYNAGAGVANGLTISTAGNTSYVFTDTRETIVAPGFVGSGTNSVIVPTAFVGSMDINLGDGNDVIVIEATFDPTTIRGGNGNDTVDVGKAVNGTLGSILAPITVDGEADSDALRINDSASGSARTYTVTATSVTPSGNPAISYVDVERLTATAGDQNDTFAVRSTALGTTTTLSSGAGFDTFNVGSTANTLDDIRGYLSLVGGTNFSSPSFFPDRLFLFDQGSVASNSYAVRANSVARSGGVVVEHSGVEDVTVNAGSAADAAVVIATAPTTYVTLNMGGGNDQVDIATRTGSSLDLIGFAVAVNGQAGTDAVYLNDNIDNNGNSYVINATVVSRNGSAILSYGTIENLTLNGTAFDDTIAVQGTVAATPVTLKSGAGNDTVTVGNASGSLDPTVGIVTVDGQTGTDWLTVNDQGPSVFFQGYTVTATSVARDGWVTVRYAGLENLTLNGTNASDPTGSNLFTVTSTSIATEINGAVNGHNFFQVGNDPLDISIQGALTLKGSGLGNLVLNDDLETESTSYTVTANSVGRSGAAPISYSKTGSLIITGGAAPDAVTVTSTSPDTPVTLDLYGTSAMYGTEDTVTLGEGLIGLGLIESPVTVPAPWLPRIDIVLNDANTFGGKDYRVSAREVTRNGRTILTHAAAGYTLAINAGAGNDTFRLASTFAGAPVVVRGGAGYDTFRFEGVGGPGLAGSVTLDGQGDGDTLDYSAFSYPGSVYVNLAMGAASLYAGGVGNFENVIGSPGNDILVGSDIANSLIGGFGRDILIGRGGTDALAGGADDDILIGGRTVYDLNSTALLALMAEWERGDFGGTAQSQYDTRVRHLLGTLPGGENGTTFLTLSKVSDDGAVDTLDGGTGLDWYFQLGGDTIVGLGATERVN